MSSAFISFCNDAIQQRAFKTDDARQAVASVPIPKQYPAFPAVKIARLGVDVAFQRGGIGTFLLNITKAFFRCYNRTGCRFVTVEAYKNDRALAFYMKNDFAFLTDKDQGKNQRTMFFDLLRTDDSEVHRVAIGLNYPSI